MEPTYNTPGVFVTETNAFPDTVTRAETAIAAFIGYTPQAKHKGKSCLYQPTLVTSIAEFLEIYGYPPDPKTKQTPLPYSPSYYLTQHTAQPQKGTAYTLNGDFYTIEPDPNTIYYLYTSLLLFFRNGGKKAYIVSVGSYGQASGKPIAPGEQIVNPNVRLNDLEKGLASLKKVPEVTMYLFPEATLLTSDDNSALIKSALAQCEHMQNPLSIFDIIGGREPDPILWMQDIEHFRNSTGDEFLKNGVAYYPNLKTTLIPEKEVTHLNIHGGEISILKKLLTPPSAPNTQVENILKTIEKGNPIENSDALAKVSATFQQIRSIVLEKINTIPPGGAMAGIYSLVDDTTGVWAAPANISPAGVTDLTLRISDQQQENLNVDAVSGKSINAIRYFNGQGVLVWGARTLNGNSQDWRYVNVVRAVTMIEQSAKTALNNYVFSANTQETWDQIKLSFSGFLTNIWKEGGLQGTKTSDAFKVECGLGTTMTAQDITDGNLRVTLFLAVTHPAEFIVVNLEQQLATS